MNTLEQEFENSLKNYSGDKKVLLSIDSFTHKLLEELPFHFKEWMNPLMTGNPAVQPISKIDIEVDSSGLIYAGLLSEKNTCEVSEGRCSNLFDWGIASLDEEPDEFEKRQNLVAQFLAICYQRALPEACKTQEFLSLPRSEKIVFSIGAHAGWFFNELYIYEGERNEIDYGNVRLLKLNLKTKYTTKPDTLENRFVQHMHNIDTEQCSEELILSFTKFLDWLLEQDVKPLEYMCIAWWSNLEKLAFAAGSDEEDVFYQGPEYIKFAHWFHNEIPEDLNSETMNRLREAINYKIAEIACLASEKVEKLETFKKIPKVKDGFFMDVFNQSEGGDTEFYPFEDTSRN